MFDLFASHRNETALALTPALAAHCAGRDFFVIALLAVLVGCGWWYLQPTVRRTDGVQYGQRHGKALTLDVIGVNSNLPPTLIYHGDADSWVPLDQSQRFRDRAAEWGREVKIVVHPGGKHGWLTMIWDIRKFAHWLDNDLR